MFKTFYLSLVFTVFNLFSVASAQQGTSSVKLFFEKVYVQTDRTFYASGDDIWMKAYLVNAQTNYLTNTSNNLYIELIDPAGIIAQREVVRMDNGIGVGDFKLSDSINAGSYRIRAYTNWMRNFGNHFIFEKDIKIASLLATGKRSFTGTASTGAHLNAARYHAQFFPEGGTLVEGVPTVVAFKAEDLNGNGIPATGAVLSDKNDTVARFATAHLGMGNFTFKPLPNMHYKAVVQYKGGKFEAAEFPTVSPNGYVLNVTADDTSAFNVSVYGNAATTAIHPQNLLTIAARHAGKIIFKRQLSLANGRGFLAIPMRDFPAGIASITLYDEDLRPYCERLVYVEDKNPVTLSISTDKTSYQSKEQVTVNISATDAQHQPVIAALSLAAVDVSMDKNAAQNISSYLLLQSEVKGTIEDATSYFDPSNTNRLQQLDLLLQTQGWRSFLWRQIADTTLKISYLPEQGITISGKVKELFGNKPLAGMNITLMAPAAKGNKLYTTTTDATGRYFLDGLPLYGNQTVKINSKNDKGKKGGLLLIDTLFNDPLSAYPIASAETDTSSFFKNFEHEMQGRLVASKNNNWYNILPNVTVTNKRSTVVLRDGNAYMNFGYPEYDFTISKNDYQYQTLQDFLVHKVPGTQYDVAGEGIDFIANGKPVRPRFVVDKREDVFERIDYYTVHMDQVISVSVRHVVGHPTFNRSESDVGRLDLGLNNTDVFIVYLELKPGAYNNDLAFINTDVNGYYEARIFYSPNYATLPDKTKPDMRTTIFWEPFINTDASGKATLTFYNADPATTIRLDVQGMSDKGSPLANSSEYKVQ